MLTQTYLNAWLFDAKMPIIVNVVSLSTQGVILICFTKVDNINSHKPCVTPDVSNSEEFKIIFLF